MSGGHSRMAEQGSRPFAAPVFFGAFALLFLGGAWAMWPPGIFGLPFADVPGGMLLRAIAAPVMAIVGLEFLGAFVVVLLADD